MTAYSSSRGLFAGAVIGCLVLTGGCDSPVASSTSSPANSPVLAVSESAAGKLTLRILAEGVGTRRYLLGTNPDTLRIAELAVRITAEAEKIANDPTLYLYTYPEARGYDVLRAMQVAQQAGANRVVGIADFSDNASFIARMKWKEWSQELKAPERAKSSADSLHSHVK